MKCPCLLIVLALALVGCGPKEVTVHTDNGSATVNSGNGTTHIEATDKEGTKVTENIDAKGVHASTSKGETFDAGAGAVSEADLKLPFYPGSTGTGGSMKVDSTESTGAISNRTTKDNPGQVVEFYKSKFKVAQTTSNNMGGQEMNALTGKLDDGSDVSVMATKNQGDAETKIMVTVGKKKKS